MIKRDRVRWVMLSLLPALTLIAGVGVAGASVGGGWPAQPDLRVALTSAAIVPPFAMLALKVVVPGFDLVLVSAAAMLAAIGTTALYQLGTTPGPNQEFYQAIAVRQGLFVGAGFVALIVGAILARRLDQIMRYPYTLLGIALLLTAVTVIFGESVNGARLWLRIGPVQFQPSEIARLLLAGFAAAYLYDRRHLVAAPWRIHSVDLPPAPYLLPLAGAVLAAVAVLVLQNDLGMAALVVLGAFASVTGVVSSKSSLGSAAGFLTLAALASFVAAPRVRDRVAGWVDPWRDPSGRGFQFVQADYGLAAGGLVGHGDATPAATVPEIHTDFILVGVGSLFGWLAALAVLALAGVLVCRCALAALRAPDGFRSLVALSVAALIGIQVLLIAGGTLRVLPLTGLTFPLVSYGGTSMVVTLFALGIVVGAGIPRARGFQSSNQAGRHVVGQPG